MNEEVFASLPERLSLREVRVQFGQKGFRPQSLLLVSTLRDTEQAPLYEIAGLYRRSWEI